MLLRSYPSHDVKSMTGKLGNHLSDVAKTSLSASCESLSGGGGGDLLAFADA